MCKNGCKYKRRRIIFFRLPNTLYSKLSNKFLVFQYTGIRSKLADTKQDDLNLNDFLA